MGNDRQNSVQNGGAAPLNPMAMQVSDAARLLGVPEMTVRQHVQAGAPTAADGTMNLVHYAAWLNVELKRRMDGD
ncbi:MAG: hypothetical protein WD294_02250 [Phycisphaeraceae bacterium]